jgi:lipopolysaccharide/colanic/teichoic acid biosynthesis glycosyltransferase
MFIKRIFDITLSLLGLTLFSLFLIIISLIVWLQDFGSPLYISERVGKNGKLFKIFKLRSMVKNASSFGIDSTASNDNRITPIGHFIRKFKLDELTQFMNVLFGQMSLVGPRPNVLSETNLYTAQEKKILTVKPGITDFASIVFSDEGEILAEKSDPDLAYNQLIRPWKSRLGILYSDKQSFTLDLILILTTVVSFFSRSLSLQIVGRVLKYLQVDKKIIEVASRRTKLTPFPPPGSSEIVSSRLPQSKFLG